MSHFIEKQLQLRDQRACQVRLLRETDSASMNALERALILAKDGMVKYEDEIQDQEAYAAMVKSHTETKGALYLVAELNGQVVAEASLRRFPLRMLRHVGILTLGIHPIVQGVGLGKALFEMLILWARNYNELDDQRLLRLELYVRADNPRAIKLYQSFGFEIEGTRRGFVRSEEGTLIDDYVMGLLL